VNKVEDTPKNRELFIERARGKMRENWRRAWFAIATRDGKGQFVIRGVTKEGQHVHLNESGVPCDDFGLPGEYLAGQAELIKAGFLVGNFSGTDPALEISE
jgi:hypothetical protein